MSASAATLFILSGATMCAVFSMRASDAASTYPLLLQFLGLAVNVASVSVPGRFDSDVDASNMMFPWPSLFTPAGFAFAIWGVIYLGEFAGAAALLVSTKDVTAVLAPSSLAWTCANLAQAFWCASFRPWALDKMWLSTACLAATAFCLFTSQRTLLASLAEPRQPWRWWPLVVVPRSLHCGWVTAATLVNVNAFVGKAAFGAPVAFACAVLSLFAGVVLSEFYASFGLRAASAAISWALFAVSKGRPVGRDAEALGSVALSGFALLASVASVLALFPVVRRMWDAVIQRAIK